MTLTTTDNTTLEKWFVTLQTLEKGSDAYLALRDKIYTYIYRRLMDMLKTKVYEWKRKYNLDEEDVISIFHDSLLRSVDKYQPKRVKFITYFWQSCENTAKNYYKKYKCQRRIPNSSLFHVDFDELHNQADIIATSSKLTSDGFEENSQLCKITEQLKNLYDQEMYNAEMSQLAKDNIISLLPYLSEVETRIFEKIVEGHPISKIAQLLSLRVQQVDAYVSKIQHKACKVIQ